MISEKQVVTKHGVSQKRNIIVHGNAQYMKLLKLVQMIEMDIGHWTICDRVIEFDVKLHNKKRSNISAISRIESVSESDRGQGVK